MRCLSATNVSLRDATFGLRSGDIGGIYFSGCIATLQHPDDGGYYTP